MSFTLTRDEDVLQVRATIFGADELKVLIAALEKRIEKFPDHTNAKPVEKTE